MIKAKRGNQGLRATAEEVGNVSAATLSRVEQGNIPDVDTFISLCRWLEVSTETFILSEDKQKKRDASVKDLVVAHLRADRTLGRDAAETLIQVINHFYYKQI
ncbi:MAG: helix-turn-helix domain-containing protein [Bacteroidetes bacterium]|nr:helix-turn-helix domain-containing protein [Bacteroidota bacterium]